MSEGGPVRFFRRLFQGVYYALVVGFVAVVGYSATVGAFTHSGSETTTNQAAITPENAAGQKCMVDLAELHNRLHFEAQMAFRTADIKDSERKWDSVSNAWRRDLEDVTGRCHLKSAKAMKPVLKFAKDVERVHMAFDTGLRAFRNVAKKPVGRIRRLHEREEVLPSLPTE